MAQTKFVIFGRNCETFNPKVFFADFCSEKASAIWRLSVNSQDLVLGSHEHYYSINSTQTLKVAHQMFNTQKMKKEVQYTNDATIRLKHCTTAVVMVSALLT